MTSDANPAARVRAKEFQLGWAAKFGVQVSTRDAASGEVLAAKCLFCARFGRDADAEEPARKRKRTTNVQHFKQPWRGDNIASHMRKQHALRFAAYCALSLPDKARYFDGDNDNGDDDGEGEAGGEGHDGAPEVAALSSALERPAPSAASEAPTDAAEGDEAEARTPPPAPARAREDAAVGMSRLVDAGGNRPETRLQRTAASPVAAVDAPVAADTRVKVPTLAAALAVAVKTSDEQRGDGGSFFQLVDKRLGLFAYRELLSLDRDADSLPAAFALLPEDEPDGGAVDVDAGRCLLRVGDPQQFAQTVSFLAAGFAPQLCEELLRLASGDHEPHEPRALTHARLACAMNYQAISELLRAAWAFSLVFDAGLAAGRAVAVRVRCVVDGKLHDVHLVALPDASEPDAMAQRLVRAADAVCAGWREKLVGIANDGAVSVSASLAAVVARLQQQHVAFLGCYAAWNGAREVEAVVQRAFGRLCDDAFVATMLQLVGHLRRRRHIVTGACPVFAGSQWTAMRDALAWFAANEAAVRRHLEDEKPSCGAAYAPADAWWVALFSLHALAKEASACLASMQGLTTHGAEQNRAIEKLLITLVAHGFVDGPSRFRDEPAVGARSGEYRVTYESAEMFIKTQGAAADRVLAKVFGEDLALHATLLRRVAQLLAEVVSSLAKLRSERARAAGLSDILPPVRPQDLVATTAFDLSRLVSLQRDRLTLSLGEHEPKRIAAEFAELLAACEREAALKNALESLPATASFAASWERVGGRFPSLERFAGGLASVFRDPSASGACDSSSPLMRVDAAAVASSSHAALECTLHARQFHSLQRVSASRSHDAHLFFATMRVRCWSASVERRYFSSAFSTAHVVSWTLHALALVLPLILAHGSQGFWTRVGSYREQPRVASTYQVLSVLEGVTVDPATQAQEHLAILQTTLPSRVQRLLQENARASQFKSYEVDADRDGIADSLHVDITTPLSPNERIHQVTVIAVLNYTLQGHVKMSMDAIAMHSQSSALAGESLYLDGTLVSEQRKPFHVTQSTQLPYAATPLFNLSKVQSAQDLSVQKLVAQYRQREYAVYFASPHPVWTTDASRGVLATTRPRQFRISLVVRIPVVDVLYHPTWAEVLKTAWIQYYCLLVVVSAFTSALVAFVFEHKVVDAFSVLADPRIALAKKTH